ncbi:MAG: hypothetical protein HXS52_01345 [Theionarchaea archaeon]|nr:hypothetical protein [Theionarchaea archaeon]MBU7036547.1 hypothetical protein [Theionarchaea archaeon]
MGWNLAYSHDKDGNRTAGSITTLIKAIMNGQPVRVVHGSGNEGYATDAQCLWVRNGIVYAQNVSHVSVIFKEDVLLFQDDSYYWMLVFSTMGDRDEIRWNIGEHASRGHTHAKIPLNWFVEK